MFLFDILHEFFSRSHDKFSAFASNANKQRFFKNYTLAMSRQQPCKNIYLSGFQLGTTAKEVRWKFQVNKNMFSACEYDTPSTLAPRSSVTCARSCPTWADSKW